MQRESNVKFKKTMIRGDERLNWEEKSWRKWKVEQSKNWKKIIIIRTDANYLAQKEFCKIYCKPSIIIRTKFS